MLTSTLTDTIYHHILEQKDFTDAGVPAPENGFWKRLRATGTDLWLDTGDIEAATPLWNSSFSALTTNNTLLNAEIQKGIYDAFIARSAPLVAGLEPSRQIIEIAFMLNGLHGLRLVRTFGGRVSVELHTACARDLEATLGYARRFYALCPDNFIVKVPYTPEGLLAVRILRREKIPVNFTLGFSARQNYLAAWVAAPTYVNVFLGRLGAWVADNNLGSGTMVGEKATFASQRGLREVREEGGPEVLQIAASMRSPSQVRDLAGVDVFTMPVKVAGGAAAQDSQDFSDQTAQDPRVGFTPPSGMKLPRMETLWEIETPFRDAVREVAAREMSPVELVAQMTRNGYGDLFPTFSADEETVLRQEGKIPPLKTWAARLGQGTLAPDSLMTAAALSAFEKDQEALDNRIREVLADA